MTGKLSMDAQLIKIRMVGLGVQLKLMLVEIIYVETNTGDTVNAFISMNIFFLFHSRGY